MVSAGGVWVVVADHDLGRIRCDAAALSVERRRDAFAQQGAACGSVLSSIGFDWLEVTLVLCGTNARSILRRPVDIDGIWLTTPAALVSMVSRPGSLSHADVATVAAELSRRLPAAR